MSKQIVLCLDGTNNEVRSADNTNVLLTYQLLALGDPSTQVAFYQPGVGTFSAPGAWTPLARRTTKLLGLAFGVGLKQNLRDAYVYLMNTYQPGDHIYVFGFSRGAYTARALTGMLAVFGLFRPGSEGLVPYAISAMSRGDLNTTPDTGPAATFSRQDEGSDNTETRTTDNPYWQLVLEFADSFAQRGLNNAIPVTVDFLGLWDTVKAAGTLRRQIIWPYTRHLPHVLTVRHAISIDEWRHPYASYGLDALTTTGSIDQDLQEVWFAGVHSDVGGNFPDGGHLSRIPFKWMMQQAVQAGMLVDAEQYETSQTQVIAADAVAKPHTMSPWWLLAGGRTRRHIPEGAWVHSSVETRIQADPTYRQRLPRQWQEADKNWLTSTDTSSTVADP